MAGGAMAGADGRGAANGAALRTGTTGTGPGCGEAWRPCAGDPCDGWNGGGAADAPPLRLWSAAWKLCGGGADGDRTRDAGNAGAAPRTGIVRAGDTGM